MDANSTCPDPDQVRQHVQRWVPVTGVADIVLNYADATKMHWVARGCKLWKIGWNVPPPGRLYSYPIDELMFEVLSAETEHRQTHAKKQQYALDAAASLLVGLSLWSQQSK